MTNPALTDRIREVQRRMDERGVRLGGVTWSAAVGEREFEECATGLCEMLEAYLDGRYKPAPPLNDSICVGCGRPAYEHRLESACERWRK